MPKISPIQESFANGVVSPLLFGRKSAEGYQAGVAELINMYPDSRGPAVSRAGSAHVGARTGVNDGRIMSIPVSDTFFYNLIFFDQVLLIGSIIGHNPAVTYTNNSNFVFGGNSWATNTDGNASSTVEFLNSKCQLEVADSPNRFAYVAQQFSFPASGNYRIVAVFDGDAPMTFNIGTTEDGAEIASFVVNPAVGELEEVINFPATGPYWITARIDSDNSNVLHNEMSFFGATDEFESQIQFVTPYLEDDLEALQSVVVPGGNAIYVLHEKYPPYKLNYNRVTDSFAWAIVSFTSEPPQWTTGSYPSTGDFFEGRLWLGGTVNEPQTFWASKSGLPEDFTLGDLADEAMVFTLSKYGRIEWMVGFKNLLIGTQTGEHIVTSDGGVITPSDINVEQQSSYGSANIQPVQVGDQVFYVSADRRKVRAIQYEWKADNWLSWDLTFNSEHLTQPGIKHISWQQNPGNAFHCILESGDVASMIYERSNNVYGWTILHWGGEGKIIDVTSGPINGTDFANLLVQYIPDTINFETQVSTANRQFMDSWINTEPDVPDGLIVSGLDHLNGFLCHVKVDGALQPDQVVVGGQITLQSTGLEVVVGLPFTARLKTLPLDKGAPSGSGTPYRKRYNKIQVAVLNSDKPLINGDRPATRHPSTPMNTVEPPSTERVTVYNVGWDQNAQVTIEQDLPLPLTIIDIAGEVAQEIL